MVAVHAGEGDRAFRGDERDRVRAEGAAGRIVRDAVQPRPAAGEDAGAEEGGLALHLVLLVAQDHLLNICPAPLADDPAERQRAARVVTAVVTPTAIVASSRTCLVRASGGWKSARWRTHRGKRRSGPRSPPGRRRRARRRTDRPRPCRAQPS